MLVFGVNCFAKNVQFLTFRLHLTIKKKKELTKAKFQQKKNFIAFFIVAPQHNLKNTKK